MTPDKYMHVAEGYNDVAETAVKESDPLRDMCK
jgi:hypothetical protein